MLYIFPRLFLRIDPSTALQLQIASPTATHPHASRHQCNQCIWCTEPWAHLGAQGLSEHPFGLRRFEWCFHQDSQHSFVFSAASKKQMIDNHKCIFQKGSGSASLRTSDREKQLCICHKSMFSLVLKSQSQHLSQHE